MKSIANNRVGYTLLAAAAAIALIIGVTTASSNATNTPSETSFIIAGKGCDVNAVANAALQARGFTTEQYVLGQDQVNWAEPEANERGDAAFATETPTTAQAVIDELNSGTPEANAAKQMLLDQSGVTPEQLSNPANWVPAQFTVDTTMPGNTGFINGAPVAVGERQSASGDVVWLLVHPDKCVQADNGSIPVEDSVTAHRAGCGNPQTELPRPTTPSSSVPPGTTPTTTPGTTTTTTGGKDHNLSPVTDDRNDPDERVRPNIPAPPEVIRTPGTTLPPYTPPVTIADPPEVSNPLPAIPGIPDLPPTPVDPGQDGGDTSGDGIPD